MSTPTGDKMQRSGLADEHGEKGFFQGAANAVSAFIACAKGRLACPRREVKGRQLRECVYIRLMVRLGPCGSVACYASRDHACASRVPPV